MKKNYKIAIVGLGSIGKRHLMNILDELKDRNISCTIDLIRSNPQKKISEDVGKFINNCYYTTEEVPDDYDAIFISNPTHLHYETIQTFAPKSKNLFIEKPIFDNPNQSIEELNLNKKSIYYVACPLRYMDIIDFVRQKFDLKNVLCARVISSSYLPNWRKHVDYRKSYSAFETKGGGVSLDLIHEWDYIQYLFGKPLEIHNFRGKVSDLEIDSDDISIYIAKYKNMMVEVHLDYFGQEIIREMQLFMKDDTVKVDLVKNELVFQKSKETIRFHDTRDDFQRKEITYFFDLIEGKKINHNTIDQAFETLKLAKEAISL
ncbi:Oxidoreductase [Petrocella atlantisensis]|uniref:Oxidoreductase n=1 Tax=Petrocella atlantisensis TaxID=2173034 RepID=A0A3P7PHZ6_9FIRM|nr:Gfo/Idh/MocA family oxidoreductase [Petrocella atlantisensis]VDN48548.1 Oxidoreductase [Petrocella atlantisensis]